MSGNRKGKGMYGFIIRFVKFCEMLRDVGGIKRGKNNIQCKESRVKIRNRKGERNIRFYNIS